jgi:HEPN domain-containing protein
LAKYDLKTAEAMFESRRYVYVLFTCQQAIEKILKALVVKVKQQFPPRIHDLLKLAQVAQIDLDNEQREFLAKLSFYYIETRYPEELSKISKSITRKIAGEYLGKTKEVIKWLRKEF